MKLFLIMLFSMFLLSCSSVVIHRVNGQQIRLNEKLEKIKVEERARIFSANLQADLVSYIGKEHKLSIECVDVIFSQDLMASIATLEVVVDKILVYHGYLYYLNKDFRWNSIWFSLIENPDGLKQLQESITKYKL